MPPTADRRDFLRTAGVLGLGLAARPLAAQTASPASLAYPPDANPPALPAGAVARLGSGRMRAGRYIHGFKFAPAGQLLVAADSDAIWGWDAATGKTAFRFKYPEASVSDGVLTSSGTLVLLIRVGGDTEYELRHYAVPSGARKSAVKIRFGNSNNLTIGPEALFVANAASGSLKVYDGATGKELWSEKADADAVGFFPDGRKLAAGAGSLLQVFDAATGKVLAELKPDRPGGHIGPPVGSRDGKWAAAVADRNQESVTVWDVAAGTVAHTFRTDGKPLLFTPDGKRLITAAAGGAAVWDLAAGKKDRDLDLGSPGEVIASADGAVLAAKAGDSVWLYETATGNLLPQSADPPGNPGSLWFARDGKLHGQLVAWGGWAVWGPADPKPKLLRMPGTGNLAPVGLSAGGKRGLYRDDKTGEFQLRGVATGKVVRKAEFESGADTWAATPDGRTVFGFTGTAGTVFHPATGKRKEFRVVERRAGNGGGGNRLRSDALGISPDGRAAAVAADASVGPDGHGSQQVVLYDLSTGETAGPFPVEGRAGRLFVAPGGRRVAVALEPTDRGGDDRPRGAVLVFDAGRPHPVARIAAESHGDRWNVLAFSPDGRTLARPAPDDKGVTLWEAATGRPRYRFFHDGEVHALAFSPDGRTLAASCNAGPVLLWDVLGHRTTTVAAPTKPALDRAWDDLAAADAEAAFRAVRLLARYPEDSLPYLTGRLAASPAADRDRVKNLIADLNDDAFRVRDAAQRELASRIDEVAGELQLALDGNPPPESRQRLEDLLRRADRLTPERLRWVRAAEAVEWSGTPEAAKLLKLWSTGTHGGRLAIEAKKAVERMGK
jgi:WD40 repeat protein